MSRMSWRSPPACVILGGDEALLCSREIQRAILVTQQARRPVIRADSEAEVVDALTSASTFGESCLIVCPLEKVTVETVRDVIANPPPNTCLLLTHEGGLDEKKFPAIAEVHGGYRLSHMKPTSKKGLKSLAARFARKEAEDLLGAKDALDEKLADAFVARVGTELGVVAFEIQKAAAYARFEGVKAITPAHIRSLIRVSTELDLGPLREALRNRDSGKLASALARIQESSGQESVMLMLRGKGGPADLVTSWLRVALFMKKGGVQADIAQRLGLQDWSVPDAMVAINNWKVQELRDLVRDLARVDLGVLRGAPSPWCALQSSLLLACVRKSTKQ